MKPEAVEQGLINALRAWPAGEKVRQSALRSEIGCSIHELSACIQSMRYKGKLHWERLELSGSLMVEPAPSEAPALSAEPSGAELVAALRVEAVRRGVTFLSLAEQLNPKNWKSYIAQLEFAQKPQPSTVARIRALLAGEAFEPVTHKPARSNTTAQTNEAAERHSGEKEADEEMRRRSFRASEVRRPGETLADAAHRTAEAAALRAELRSTTSGNAKAQLIVDRLRGTSGLEQDRAEREFDEIATPSSLLRRAQRDWPQLCQRAAALAAATGQTLAQVWEQVLGAGLLAVEEDLREEAA